MLSEKVLPVTRNLIRERRSKSTTAAAFLLSTYSTTPSGVMTEQGIGICRRPAQEAAHPASLLA